MNEQKITVENYEQMVVQSDRPVLVDFWAPWCVYCRRLGPAFDQLAAEQAEVLRAVKVNIDEEPGLASREQVDTIPTLILYGGGQRLGAIVAPKSKAEIEAFIWEALSR